MPVKAIAFDLDGVLIDSCDWHKDALNLALQENGFPPIGPIEHKNVYNGLPTKTKLEILGIPVEKREQIEKDKQKHTEAMITRYCHHDEALVKMMWLLKQDGYKLTCVTNAITRTANLILRKLGVFPLLDTVVANEFGGSPKPSGDPYEYACKKLGCQASEVLVVEDSPKGVEAARRAGCRLLEVPARPALTYQKIKECVYNDQQFLF